MCYELEYMLQCIRKSSDRDRKYETLLESFGWWNEVKGKYFDKDSGAFR